MHGTTGELACSLNTLTVGVHPKMTIWVWGSGKLFMSGQIREKQTNGCIDVDRMKPE